MKSAKRRKNGSGGDTQKSHTKRKRPEEKGLLMVT